MKKIKLSRKEISVFVKCIFLALVCLFIILLIIRSVHYIKIQKIKNIITQIDSTQLNINDVLGNNLPNDLNLEANNSLIGLDSNKNNIRDDVEVAIFKKYPDSPIVRSVLLQYAMSLQLEVTQPFLNKDIVIKIINKQSRADTCLGDAIAPRVSEESARDIKDIEKIEEHLNFVREQQFNTEERKNEDNNFYKNLDDDNSLEIFDNLLNSQNNSCDIDLSKLEK